MFADGLQNRKQKEGHIINTGEYAVESNTIRKMIRMKRER